jgi:hypothetical protein
MKKVKKRKKCICESIYDGDTILVDAKCPIHGTGLRRLKHEKG